MDKAGNPEKPPKVSTPLTDDIPVAQRESPASVAKPQSNRLLLFSGLIAVGVVALFAGSLFALRMQSPQASNPAISASASPDASPSPSPAATSDNLLGHFPYQESPKSELEPIVPDGSIKLRKAAARDYRAMAADAEQDGVILSAISGFRSIEDQRYLYFDVKAERAQGATERAKVSAPPGYSEHHTGYAVDIGDANVPATNLSPSFDRTAAFKWLKANAARYHFELSFPKNNRQGVSYEPWHWRYVGDIHSLKTFYKARSPRQ